MSRMGEELDRLERSIQAEQATSADTGPSAPDPLTGDRERILKYHNALLNGRHPLSFPKKDTPFWQSVGRTNNRLSKVRSKQVLKTVLSGQYNLGDTVKKKNSGDVQEDKRPSTAMSHLSRFSKRSDRSGDKGDLRANRAKSSHSATGGLGTRPGTTTQSGLAALKEEMSDQDRRRRKNSKFLARARKEEDEIRREIARYTETDFSFVVGAKIFYGSMVAFERSSKNGHWLTVTHDGDVTVDRSMARAGCGQYVFTLMNMNHPADQGPVKFGDPVWLAITSGIGDKWQNGSVIGSRMKSAVNLIEETRPDNAKMGDATPVRAYIPNEKHAHRNDHLDHTATNRLPIVVGKWKLRPALRTEHEENQVQTKQLFNLSEVYLEQDWFFMAATNENTVELRKSLLQSQDAAAGKYMMPISGVWRMHLVEAQSTGTGTRSAERVEHLLYKARQQLHTSIEMRGGKKQYIKGGANGEGQLRGGEKFPVQIRRLIQSHDLVQESNFLHNQEACSRSHFSRGRSSKVNAIQRQFETNMQASIRRTNGSPKSSEKNARKMVESLKMAGPNISVKWQQKMQRRNSVSADGVQNVGGKTTKGKNSLYRLRKPKGASEWYRRMCGVDLNQVDKEVNQDLVQEHKLSAEESAAMRKKKNMLDEGYMKRIEATERLPIFAQMSAEDERMVQVLQHREANRAFIEFYAGMFADVEW